MNCDEATGRFLADEASDAVTGHLETCSSCRRARASLEAARDVLADPTTWEEPPDALADQVVSLVSGAARPGTQAPRRRRLVRSVAAVAAVAVVATVAFLVVDRPDWEVAMPGTELAAGATSTVRGWNTDAGTAMEVEVSGLGPAPAGHVYELWLSGPGLHVSAGTFTTDGLLEMTTGVRRADFPRLWVTVEPIAGGGGPSGDTVLDTG